MRIEQIKKNCELFNHNVLYGIKQRREYLNNALLRWMDYFNMDTEEIPEIDLGQIFNELKQLHRHTFVKRETSLSKITDEMIQNAKRYPIEDLIVFNKNKAICFAHQDSVPSLYLYRKTNTAYCPVCAKAFNPIDVLITRDGLNFIKAVKELSR